MKNNSAIADFKLPLSTSEGLYFFSPRQIIRLEAKSNYTSFYFRDHKPIMSARVLKDYARQLEPFGFIRTHRSHLVNKSYIHFVDKGGNIVMEDRFRAEISRRKKKKVMNALKTTT
jgi:two-component system, LytTR family, response regulator